CAHTGTRGRRVAIKVLPSSASYEPAQVEQFYHEARALAALDHPNVVRADDVNQEGELHFIVMEYVDGSNLREIIERTGPMDPLRAAHYLRQAALGRQHAPDNRRLHRAA